jgi:hypothetical protein
MSLILQTKERVQGRRNGIYVGGRDDAKDLTRLKTRSITHVLNLTPPKDVNVQVRLLRARLVGGMPAACLLFSINVLTFGRTYAGSMRYGIFSVFL